MIPTLLSSWAIERVWFVPPARIVLPASAGGHPDAVPEPAVPPVTLPEDVLRVLGADPGIDRVQLVGSRASGRALRQSDWDFKVETGDFTNLRDRLPGLLSPLDPVVAQWDRLSPTWCYMLILRGPVKVDLIFAQPHGILPPWHVTAATLPGIDDHFWDWLLWLSAKQAASRHDLVTAELARLHEHLLAPLGIAARPATPGQAIAAYRAARNDWERRLHCQVSRAVEQAVSPALP